jgi:hypothetical protein
MNIKTTGSQRDRSLVVWPSVGVQSATVWRRQKFPDVLLRRQRHAEGVMRLPGRTGLLRAMNFRAGLSSTFSRTVHHGNMQDLVQAENRQASKFSVTLP